MINIDVNAEALKDYSDKLQKWICILDEIESNYEASLKRVRIQNIILTRKIDSIIPEKREHYISALNDLNRFLSNMQNTNRNDTVFLRTVNVMQKSVNDRKRDLDHAIFTKTKIEKLYADCYLLNRDLLRSRESATEYHQVSLHRFPWQKQKTRSCSIKAISPKIVPMFFSLTS